jgi:hypothetical protein
VTGEESPRPRRAVALSIASHPGERPHPSRQHNILVHHGRHEPPRRGQLGHHLAFTKSAQEPNGIKLASELLLDQLLTQCLPGFDHKWEALGPPFLDAWFHAMRADGVDDQRA